MSETTPNGTMPNPFHSSKLVARRFRLQLFVMLIVLAAETIFLVTDMIGLRDAIDRQQVADRALVVIRNVSADLLDAETGQRGFLLTGDEAYLAPYIAAHTNARRTITAVLEAEPPDRLFAGEAAKLEILAARKLEELDRTVALRKGGDIQGANTIVLLGQGKAIMDEARALMQGTLNRVRAERDQIRAGIREHVDRAASIASVLGLSIIAVLLGGWRKLHASTKDVTKRAAQLSEDALHDTLTKLPNRRFFEITGAMALRQAERGIAPFTLILIDLDGFKAINDTYGHDVGDRVLVEVAQRFRNTSRGGEFIARLGGDEFAMFVTGELSRDQLQTLGERIIRSVQSSLHFSLPDLAVGASIGIATATSKHTTLDAVLVEADDALYAAKRAGRGVVRFFSERPKYNVPTVAELEGAILVRTGR